MAAFCRPGRFCARALKVQVASSSSRSCFNVNVNLDPTSWFKGKRTEDVPIKLRVHLPRGGKPKLVAWNPDEERFPDLLKRLKLAPDEWEPSFTDQWGHENAITGKADVEELFRLRHDVGGPVFIDVQKTEVEGEGATVPERMISQVSRGVSAGLDVAKKAIQHLSGYSNHTREDIQKAEKAVVSQVGCNPLKSATPTLAVISIKGVPVEKWRDHMKTIADAVALPKDKMKLCQTLKYQDSVQTSFVFPTRAGMRRFAIDAHKVDDKVFGAYVDCSFNWKQRSMEVAEALIKRIDTDQGPRAFTAWPTPPAMDQQSLHTFCGTHTFSLPEGSAFVGCEDPHFSAICAEVIEKHGWGARALLVRDDANLHAFGTKNSNSPGKRMSCSAEGKMGSADMDGRRRAATLTDCSALLLIEVFTSENFSETIEVKKLMEIVAEHECAKIAPRKLEELEEGPVATECM